MSYYKPTYAELDANVQHLLSLPLVQKLIKENEELKQENKQLVNSLMTLISSKTTPFETRHSYNNIVEPVLKPEPEQIVVPVPVKKEPEPAVIKKIPVSNPEKIVVPEQKQVVKKTPVSNPELEINKKTNEYSGIEPDAVDVAIPEDDVEMLEIKENETENIYFDIEEKPTEEDEDDECSEEEPSRIIQQEIISNAEEEVISNAEEVISNAEEVISNAEEVISNAEEEIEEEVISNAEEEEEGVEEMVIGGKTYFVSGTENGAEVYEKIREDEVGDLIGTLKNGKVVKVKKV